MIRRSFLKRLAVLPLAAAAVPSAAGASAAKLKILLQSAWRSDDPTKAAFPFLHGDALLKPATKFKSFSSAKRCLSCENQWPMQSSLLDGRPVSSPE
jgi:hypothetical protein